MELENKNILKKPGKNISEKEESVDQLDPVVKLCSWKGPKDFYWRVLPLAAHM